MTLPGSAKAVVEERKISGYLMNTAHPDGVSKARFFRSRGYREDDWETIADDLRRHGRENEVAGVAESPYGTRYVVEGPLQTPGGDSVLMITVWIIETGKDAPRLVTAYPA